MLANSVLERSAKRSLHPAAVRNAHRLARSRGTLIDIIASMGSRELLLTLVTSAETVRRFLRGPEIEEHSNITDPEDLRRLLPDRYGRDLLPRVPDRIAFDQRSGLLACQLVVSLDRLPGGFIGIPIGTKALMGALCAPFCNLNGFPVPRFASQPFMVWEHRQLYRLITGALLHQNLAHLTSNLSVLAHSGSRLEAQVGSPAFAALVGSLTLSASTLEGNSKRLQTCGYFVYRLRALCSILTSLPLLVPFVPVKPIMY